MKAELILAMLVGRNLVTEAQLVEMKKWIEGMGEYELEGFYHYSDALKKVYDN